MEIKLKFEHDLKKKGGELFNQLRNDEAKRKAAEDLEDPIKPPSINFSLSFIETLQDHPAREVLGNQECDRLVTICLVNLQYAEEVAQYNRV